jgi:hypothetical protein
MTLILKRQGLSWPELIIRPRHRKLPSSDHRAWDSFSRIRVPTVNTSGGYSFCGERIKKEVNFMEITESHGGQPPHRGSLYEKS